MSGPPFALFRLRFIIFLLFAAAGLAAFFYVPQPDPFKLVAALAGGACMAWARLRHGGLALAAALAPLPGVLWFGASAYALTLAFSILMAASYNDALLKGDDALAGLAKIIPAIAGALLFAVVWSLHEKVQIASLLAASAAAGLFLPAFASGLKFNEEAIARGNRSHESMQRFFTFAGHVAEPRWCFALGGVGVVLGVLGYFRVGPPAGFGWLAVGAAGLIVLGFTRDMRFALAALWAATLLLLFTKSISGSLLLFILFALVLGRCAKSWLGSGDGLDLAWIRAIEAYGSAILFAGLASMIATFPRGGAAAVLHAGYGLVAALILFPAFAGALYRLFPRRRSVEDIYRT